MSAKVYLTGAGPGDIELLTLKAARVIKEADVIIYDRLANPDILDMAKDGCRFVYVGKEDGRHTLPQDEINEVIYQEALKSDIVVRLKGGDPFVFGRGGEEGAYLKQRGVEFEVIPGITSAISVPAYAGIPVTHRGVAVSFRVVTGHEAKGKSDSQIPWEKYSASFLGESVFTYTTFSGGGVAAGAYLTKLLGSKLTTVVGSKVATIIAGKVVTIFGFVFAIAIDYGFNEGAKMALIDKTRNEFENTIDSILSEIKTSMYNTSVDVLYSLKQEIYKNIETKIEAKN